LKFHDYNTKASSINSTILLQCLFNQSTDPVMPRYSKQKDRKQTASNKFGPTGGSCLAGMWKRLNRKQLTF